MLLTFALVHFLHTKKYFIWIATHYIRGVSGIPSLSVYFLQQQA